MPNRPLNSTTMEITRTLYDSYDSYRMAQVKSRRLKHADLIPILESLQSSLKGILKIEQIGASSEGRSINLLTMGSGKKKIFMWSQMHGDEPTATMGILDLLSYIRSYRSAQEVEKILAETKLLILPMLNPDGAERFQRRSVHGIDINRDARQLQTVEARILKQTCDTYSPEFGFNLHDQEPRYTVGASGKPATIALLAPSIDHAKSENAVRIRAKKVAAQLVDILSPIIPGQISRYDDAFEVRAFGDNIQKWGTSTVLIESGGSAGDLEKMFIRRLNCVALLGISYAIATGEYKQANVSNYERLPENAKNLYDLIIRGATLTQPNGVAPVVIDIGINIEEVKTNDGALVRQAKVVDLGDLWTFTSYREVHAEGRSLDASRVALDTIVDAEEIVQELGGGSSR